MTAEGNYHTPVMLSQVLELLGAGSGGDFLDATVGGGGHSRALLEQAPHDTKLFGLDQDGQALAEAARKLSVFGKRVRIEQGNFRRAAAIFESVRFDGVLLDLGVSSHQFDTPERGFSCDRDGPLDMRMDAREGTTAAQLLEERDEDGLARMFRLWGESKYNRRIARRIVEHRQERPLKSTAELADLIRKAVPRQVERKNVVQIFQALRIAVNDELAALEDSLEHLFDSLKTDGRLVVISYHSLEDRIVKRGFAKLATGCVCPPGLPFCACGLKPRAKILTRKPIRPETAEVGNNPRSRSALLRAVRKLAGGDSAGEQAAR